MNKDETIRRGQAANQLLGNETLVTVLAEIEAECMAAWAESNPADLAGREDAYRMTRCVGLLRQKLTAWRDAGHLEKDNIARIDRDRRSNF